MRLIKRLKFALKYDFDPEFLVWSFPNNLAVKFLKYEDAKKFSDEQIEYIPKVVVAVKKSENRN